jgi:hypothetical protein
MSPPNDAKDSGGPNQRSTIVVAGTPITMQQLQQIYSELTGKAESISRYYDDPIRLSFDDINDLHQRILQTWEQYSLVSSACSFTIYHLKNTKEHFTSFERMQLQIASGAEPVESILVQYNFLVLLPSISKPQNYSISVRVVSRLASERRMREEYIVSLPRFLRVMAQHTASVEITYVDYSVSRAFLTAIDEWFKTIPRSPDNKLMKWLQSKSYWTPRLGRFTTTVMGRDRNCKE